MKNINRFIIFLITITIVLLIHNNKDNFTIVRDLNVIPGMQGNYGPKGPDGKKGDAGPSNEYNSGIMESQLNNQLKLGSYNSMFNDVYQLKLSGRIKPNGVKLKINKFESEDDKNYYIKCENKDTTDFYVNNKKLYLNGDYKIIGDIKVRNNNKVRSLVNDRIPSGLIFPYYFDDMSNIGSGFYLLKFDNTSEELQLRLEFHNIKGNEFKISLCNTNYKKFFLKRDTDADTNIQYVLDSDDDNCIFSLVKISNKKYKLLNNQKHLYINDNKNYKLSDNIKEFELLRTVPYGWKLKNQCKGRLIVGDNSNIPNYYKNKPGGSEDITLNQNNLPQHKHKTNVSLEYSIKTNTGTTSAESQHDHLFRVLDKHVDDENGTELAFVLAHNNHVYTDENHIYTPGNQGSYNINEFKDKYGEFPWTNTGDDDDVENKSHQMESSERFKTRNSGNHNHQFEAQFARPFFRLDNIDRNNRVTVPFAIAPESMKILYIEKE